MDDDKFKDNQIAVHKQKDTAIKDDDWQIAFDDSLPTVDSL